MNNNTRLMSRLFSATDEKDEELTNQVGKDIEDAKKNGIVDTEELTYEDQGDGKVAITDKENGEVTIAERAEDGNYDLYPASMTQQIEGFIHPEGDGVTPGQQDGEDDEYVSEHLDGELVSDYDEQNVFENAEDEDREFSVSSDNTVVLRIFSDQEFCERCFSEVIESEETAKIGDLKIEKLEDEENTVVVTDETTGDQAKVTLDDDEMEVTELESKNFGECEYGYDDPEQYNALHIVGVDTDNHVIVDAAEYDEESAQDLVDRLSEQGVDAVEIFDNPEDARDYALNLLGNLGVESTEDIDEPEQAEFSDHTIYVTRYFSNHTIFMDRLFSEAANDINVSQDKIEDAIENGEEIETDEEIVTPIDANTAIVEDKDNNEFTKVTIDGEDMNFDAISGEEASKLMENISVEDTDEDLDEREYSDYDEDERYFSDYFEDSEIYTNSEETKFFSENEVMTEYMCRLFSGEADSDEEDIADAIESGEEIEVDGEIITPVDAHTAIIEDKENGEYTKATLDVDGDIEVLPIDENNALQAMENIEVEDTDEDLDEEDEEVCTNSEDNKCFSENEVMTKYMCRLFSGEADSDEEDIADAIESGEEIEVDGEIITPIDAHTAIIEDKEENEFTKAVLNEDGNIEVTPMDQEDAKEELEDVAVEDTDEDLDEEEEEKEYSYYEDPILDKFFADAVGNQNQQQEGEPEVIPAVVDPQTGQLVPLEEAQGNENEQQQGMPVEAMEDKAMAAIQSIQAAAEQGAAMIMQAKAAPSQDQMQNLQEAQFSDFYEEDEKFFSENDIENDTLVSWLNGI